jgi:hypothetical protein
VLLTGEFNQVGVCKVVGTKYFHIQNCKQTAKRHNADTIFYLFLSQPYPYVQFTSETKKPNYSSTGNSF